MKLTTRPSAVPQRPNFRTNYICTQIPMYSSAFWRDHRRILRKVGRCLTQGINQQFLFRVDQIRVFSIPFAANNTSNLLGRPSTISHAVCIARPSRTFRVSTMHATPDEDGGCHVRRQHSSQELDSLEWRQLVCQDGPGIDT